MKTPQPGKESAKVKAVGVTLLVLTGATVLASKLNAGIAIAAGIALLIAVFKGSLVASFFMHLASERRMIVLLFVSALLLFVLMMGLIVLARYNVYEGLVHVS